MGFKTEINRVLKVKENIDNLKEGETREFQKDGARVYPVGIPVFLADRGWTVPGYAVIEDCQAIR